MTVIDSPAGEILTVADMYAADRAAIAGGVPSLALMEAAGDAIVREIERAWTPRQVAIACGPGNNGGDGFVVARRLAERGWPVRIALLGSRSALKGDAAINAERCDAAGIPIENLDVGLLDGAAIVVDALFGAGLSRGLDGQARALVDQINLRNLICVGVDVPSGVDGNTGATLPRVGSEAGVAPRCTVTVTFFRPKPAHFLYPGRALCGRVVVADIGIAASVLDTIKPRLFIDRPGLWDFPVPGARAHKYTRGHTIVFGGGKMTGAARLAARAARRIGSGLLTLAVPSTVLPIYAAEAPGAFVEPVDSGDDFDAALRDPRRNAAVIGPGFGVGPLTADRVLRLLETDKAVVVDADALTSFAGKPEVLFSACRGRSAATIFTPHEGEFVRLFNEDGGKVERTRKAASKSGAVVVFKGPDTVIASPDGRAAISVTAGPWLATGGTGDVLVGFVAGLLAQGMPAFEAASAAAWIHGTAGDRLGAGLIAEDLPEAVPGIIKSLIS